MLIYIAITYGQEEANWRTMDIRISTRIIFEKKSARIEILVDNPCLNRL